MAINRFNFSNMCNRSDCCATLGKSNCESAESIFSSAPSNLTIFSASI